MIDRETARSTTAVVMPAAMMMLLRQGTPDSLCEGAGPVTLQSIVPYVSPIGKAAMAAKHGCGLDEQLIAAAEGQLSHLQKDRARSPIPL